MKGRPAGSVSSSGSPKLAPNERAALRPGKSPDGVTSLISVQALWPTW